MTRAATPAVVAGRAALAGCALKSPPQRDETARAGAAEPARCRAQWTAARRRRRAPSTTAGSRRSTTRSSTRWCARRSPTTPICASPAARVEQAAGYCEVAGADALSAGQPAGARRRQDGRRRVRPAGRRLSSRRWELDLWGRVRSGRRAAATRSTSPPQLDAEYARQSIAALVAKSWFLAIEARLQKRSRRGHRCARREQLAEARAATARASARRRVRRRARAGATSRRYATRCGSSTSPTSRRCARSRRCSAAIRPPRSRSPPRFRRCRGRCPAGCPRSCSSGGPTSSPPSAAWRRRSTASKKRRPRGLPRISLTANVTQHLERAVRAAEPRQPGVEPGRRPRCAALPRRRAAGAGRDPHGRAEAGGRRLRRASARALSAKSRTRSPANFAPREREPILARGGRENARALELAHVRYRVGSGDLRAVLQQQLALYAARAALAARARPSSASSASTCTSRSAAASARCACRRR